MKVWQRIQDVRAFLAERAVLERGPHQWRGRVLHWPVCDRCGLLLLKNEATRRAASAVCVTER